MPEPARLIEQVTAHLEREYGQPATLWRTRERPLHSFDEKRRQHSSRAVLEWLASRLPDPDAKMIGVTDVDLFIPVLTFVFGEAQLGGNVAIVSTARLEQRELGTVFRERLLKEAAHELGHTFGLVHCTSPTCVMSRSPSIPFVDVKTDRLCDACRMRLRELRKASPGIGAKAPAR